jgi:hypothetical protein
MTRRSQERWCERYRPTWLAKASQITAATSEAHPNLPVRRQVDDLTVSATRQAHPERRGQTPTLRSRKRTRTSWIGALSGYRGHEVKRESLVLNPFFGSLPASLSLAAIDRGFSFVFDETTT